MFNILNMNNNWKKIENLNMDEIKTVAQKDEEGYVCWNVGNSSCIWLPNMEIKDVYQYLRINFLFSHLKDIYKEDIIIVYNDIYGILINMFGKQKNICFKNYLEETEEMEKTRHLNGIDNLNILNYEDICEDVDSSKLIITLDDDITKLYNFENVKRGYLFTKENNKMMISIFDYSSTMFGLSLNKSFYFKLHGVVADDDWSIIEFARKEV
jgi:hypothetical protein